MVRSSSPFVPRWYLAANGNLPFVPQSPARQRKTPRPIGVQVDGWMSSVPSNTTASPAAFWMTVGSPFAPEQFGKFQRRYGVVPAFRSSVSPGRSPVPPQPAAPRSFHAPIAPADAAHVGARPFPFTLHAGFTVKVFAADGSASTRPTIATPTTAHT